MTHRPLNLSAIDPTPGARRPRAFTTIEILIVVVILGITAAVALPMVGNRSDLKLAAATRKVMADLQYAQNLSIATRDPVYIRVAANKYTLCKKVGTALAVITHPVDQMPFVVQLGATPSAAALANVTLATPSFAGKTVIAFDSLGTPFAFDEPTMTKTSLTATGTLTLGCGGQQQLIRIEPYTGEISVP